MTNIMRDIGSFIKGYMALIPAVITAGAGNDGVEVDGPWFDVSELEGHGAVLMIEWSAVLADTETLTLAANLQDATALAGTAAADFGTALAAVVVATSDGGTTEQGVTEMKLVEFNGNRGFVRAQVTATLSATGTDTVALGATLVVGGLNVLPGISGLHTTT